mmetsp:Transcript_640/g.1133  ORF Transcript_640/g.1133 Transcript_640/m.1133 type:complete len:572 (+) Transcript_640:54-1769(+)
MASMSINEAYAFLNIEKTATDAEVKAAFKNLALKTHPDKNPRDTTASQKFHMVSDAYQKIVRARKSEYEGVSDDSDYSDEDDDSYDDEDDEYDDDYYEEFDDLDIIREMFFFSMMGGGGNGIKFSAYPGSGCTNPNCPNCGAKSVPGTGSRATGSSTSRRDKFLSRFYGGNDKMAGDKNLSAKKEGGQPAPKLSKTAKKNAAKRAKKKEQKKQAKHTNDEKENAANSDLNNTARATGNHKARSESADDTSAYPTGTANPSSSSSSRSSPKQVGTPAAAAPGGIRAGVLESSPATTTESNRSSQNSKNRNNHNGDDDDDDDEEMGYYSAQEFGGVADDDDDDDNNSDDDDDSVISSNQQRPVLANPVPAANLAAAGPSTGLLADADGVDADLPATIAAVINSPGGVAMAVRLFREVIAGTGTGLEGARDEHIQEILAEIVAGTAGGTTPAAAAGRAGAGTTARTTAAAVLSAAITVGTAANATTAGTTTTTTTTGTTAGSTASAGAATGRAGAAATSHHRSWKLHGVYPVNPTIDAPSAASVQALANLAAAASSSSSSSSACCCCCCCWFWY